MRAARRHWRKTEPLLAREPAQRTVRLAAAAVSAVTNSLSSEEASSRTMISATGWV